MRDKLDTLALDQIGELERTGAHALVRGPEWQLGDRRAIGRAEDVLRQDADEQEPGQHA
jgi:hypothetical protein